MSKFRITMAFDMRAPDFGPPAPELYATALDMSAFADDIGVDSVGFMEHHGCDDGYLANPFIMGAAAAARTKRIRILLGAVVLPLHNPVRVAEDIAIIDQISNGRVELIFGAGYVPSEFARFDTSLSDRAKLMDKGIDIILRALSGDEHDAEGREILTRPRLIQDPRDILLVGGAVKASAIRAARFDLGLAPATSKLFELYRTEMAERGQKLRKMYGPARPMSIFIAEDVDAFWADLLQPALHCAQSYAAWAEETGSFKSPYHGLDNEEAMRASGLFRVCTPDEVIEIAANLPPYGALGFQPIMGGLAINRAWESLRHLEKIMPQLKELQNS